MKINTSMNNKVLKIYTMNDFHGMLFEDDEYAGISKIGDFLIKEKFENPDSVIILSAGDMFQGSVVSSMSRGLAVVDVMNIIGFDAMTLGNHEFDWGIETILQYSDDDFSNGELNCQYLAANINYKATNELVSWAKPYIVIEKLGCKIGVLGLIGAEQEKDILKTNVEKYEFTDEFLAVLKYVPILRQKENCDIVIVCMHADTSAINDKFADLTDEYQIDVIINGHTHSAYYGEYDREIAPLACVQSGCYGKYIGFIELIIDSNTNQIVDVSVDNIKAIQKCKTENELINKALLKYNDYKKIANAVFGKVGTFIDKDKGGVWAANALKDAFDMDLALCNMGGIRNSAFPLYEGSDLKYGDIFKMMPFENTVVLVSMTGKDVKSLIKEDGFYFSSNVNCEHSTIDNKCLEDNYYYGIAMPDYVFDNYCSLFEKACETENTHKLFRDILVSEAKKNIEKNGVFK